MFSVSWDFFFYKFQILPPKYFRYHSFCYIHLGKILTHLCTISLQLPRMPSENNQQGQVVYRIFLIYLLTVSFCLLCTLMDMHKVQYYECLFNSSSIDYKSQQARAKSIPIIFLLKSMGIGCLKQESIIVTDFNALLGIYININSTHIILDPVTSKTENLYLYILAWIKFSSWTMLIKSQP